jgi:hypothetical protein
MGFLLRYLILAVLVHGFSIHADENPANVKLSTVGECKDRFRCLPSEDLGKGLAALFADPATPKDQIVAKVEAVITESINAGRNDSLQRNYKSAIQEGFAALLPRVDDFTPAHAKRIAGAFARWMRSKASDCNQRAYVCREVAETFKVGIAPLKNCAALDAFAPTFSERAEQENRKAKHDSLLVRNYYEAYRVVQNQRVAAGCAKMPEGKTKTTDSDSDSDQ